MKSSPITNCVLGLTLGLGMHANKAPAGQTGALYTMDNAADANHVLVFEREQNGRLVGAETVATGGSGAGTHQGLPSQGSILLSHDGRWLFACNAGSSEISVFAVSRNGLTLTDKVPSGGVMPLSLALHHNLLYVLNAGGLAGDQDNISGFIFAAGRLVALPNSTRALSAVNTGPAQVSFTRDGNTLVITERVTSLIDTFPVGDDGLPLALKTSASAGSTPFGFDVGHEDRLFVSEAAGGAANASSASSYMVSDEGELTVISGAVPTEQTAACWLITSHDGRFVYTANAGSGSISGFRVGVDGRLELVTPGGQTGTTGMGSHPTDFAQSRDGRFLYSLNNGNGTISAFKTGPDGSLHPLMTLSGLPTTAAGLAGR